MNIMISAVGLDPRFASFAAGGTAGGALFVVAFSAIGLVLFVVAGCLLGRCRETPSSVPYSVPRM
ncbi:MAG: hypothetical protein KGM24_11400 [Elusimicrobia bacterium]|nr:hypothetical protein [Elusimicrobiota bacterium]